LSKSCNIHINLDGLIPVEHIETICVTTQRKPYVPEWDGKPIKLWQLKLSQERPPATPKRREFDRVSYTGW